MTLEERKALVNRFKDAWARKENWPENWCKILYIIAASEQAKNHFGTIDASLEYAIYLINRCDNAQQVFDKYMPLVEEL